MTARTLRTAAQLVDAGLIAVEDRASVEAVAERYAIAITQAVQQSITGAPAEDPVARQYVPTGAELTERPDEHADPIGDIRHSPLPGLIHRYPDRVLLKATNVCPVYCRFCFRRETVGPAADPPLSEAALDRIVGYLRDHEEVWEVILSGGDPLSLSERRLHGIIDRLATVPHLRIVRIHSRVPVSDPDRITPALIDRLRQTRLTPWLVIHANHPQEFTAAARRAIARLADAGVPLRSQTVLLRGVNDDEATLAELMRTFVELRVAPYYLHQLDRAPGTSHFAVNVERGQALMRSLRGHYSGLCQPEYVLDIPGGHGKSPIGESYLASEEGEYRVKDFRERWHRYREDN